MSDFIDNRIVSLGLDNSDFERNAEKSTKTLEKLDKSLDISESAKEFDSSLVAIDKVDFGNLVASVDKIADRFSFFGSIGRDVLNTITSSAQNLLHTLSQTIDSMGIVSGMSSGWGKYNAYVSSTQTIQSALPDMSIEDIESTLDKLMWYTDETSYDFTSMVDSIGKFTSAGMDLEGSVTAMEGIANWAAASGVNARDATRAFYNISQAIGAGAMKTVDWKSIEMLNMGTKEFKTQAIEAGLAAGTLEQRVDGIYGANSKGTMIKLADDVETMANSFRETLSGGWFSSDVMMSVFGKYGEYADALFKAIEEEGYDNASEAMEHISEEGMELAAKAFKNAQVAKTFEDAIAATQDAVSSGWLKTWEILFGNLDEASDLWTNLANDLWEIFASGGEARNEMLSEWHDGVSILIEDYPELRGVLDDAMEDQSAFLDQQERLHGAINEFDISEAKATVSGYERMVEALTNSLHYFMDILSTVKEAISEVIPPVTGESLIILTLRFQEFTERLVDASHEIPTLTRIHKIITQIGSAIKEFVTPFLAVFNSFVKGILNDFSDTFASFGDNLNIDANRLARISQIASNVAQFLGSIVNILRIAIKNLVAAVKPGLIDFWNYLSDSIASVTDNLDTGLPIFQAVVSVAKTIGKAIGTIFRLIGSVVYILSPLWNAIKSIIDALFEGTHSISEWISGIIQSTTESEKFKSIVESLHGLIESLSNFIVTAVKKIQDVIHKISPMLSPITNSLSNIFAIILDNIPNVIDSISGWLDKFSGINSETGEVNGALDVASGTLSTIGSFLTGTIGPIVGEILGDVTDIVSLLVDDLLAVLKNFSLGDIFDMGLDVAKIAVLLDLGKMLKSGKGAFESIRGFFESFTKKSSKSKSFLKVAAAIFLIADGLYKLALGIDVLSKVNFGSAMSAVLVMTIVLGVLVGAVALISQISKKLSLKTVLGLVVMLEALKAIPDAISSLAGLPFDKMMEAVLALSVVLAAIAGCVTLISAVKGKASLGDAAAIAAFVWAIKEIPDALEQIAGIPFAQQQQAVLALVEVIAAIGLVVLAISAVPGKTSIGDAVAIVALVVAIKAIPNALEQIAGIPYEQLKSATESLIEVLAAIGLVVVAISAIPGSTSIGDAIAVASLVMAIKEIPDALATIAVIPYEGLISAEQALEDILAELGIVVLAISVIPGSSSIGDALALAALALDIKVAADAIALLGTVPADQLDQAATALKSILAVSTILVGVAGLVGDVGSAATLAGLALVILAIGEALNLSAEASIKFNTALAMLIPILPPLAVSISAFLETMINGVDNALHLIWENIKAWAIQVAYDIPFLAAEIISAFLKGLSDGISLLSETLGPILTNIGEWISGVWENLKGFGKRLWEGLKEGITTILSAETWSNVWGKIVTGIKDFLGLDGGESTVFKGFGGNTISGFMSGIGEKIENAVAKIKEFGQKVLDGIKSFFGINGDNSSEMEGVGKNTGEGFIKGLGGKINGAVEKMREFGQKVLDKIKGLFGINSPSTVLDEVGQNTAQGFINGVDGKKESAVDKMRAFGESVLNKLKDTFGGSNSSEFGSVATNAISALKNVFTNSVDSAKQAVTKVASGILSAVKDKLGGASSSGGLGSIGQNAMSGLINGLKEKWNNLQNVVASIGSSIINKLKSTLQTHSPSKLTTQIGEWVAEGLGNGIQNKAYISEENASEMGEDAINAMGKSLEGLWTMTEFDDIDNEIHFTIVVDNQEALAQLEAFRNGFGYSEELRSKFGATSALLAKRAMNSFVEVTSKDPEEDKDDSESSSDKVVFNQYNYSPKSLSRLDIYRNTRQQLLEFQRSGK